MRVRERRTAYIFIRYSPRTRCLMFQIVVDYKPAARCSLHFSSDAGGYCLSFAPHGAKENNGRPYWYVQWETAVHDHENTAGPTRQVVLSTATPVRSCAVCRTRAPQHTLIRVVRAPDGTIRVDCGAHRAAGRGAYICHAERCLQKAARALGRALKVSVPAEFANELQQAVTKGKGDDAMS